MHIFSLSAWVWGLSLCHLYCFCFCSCVVALSLPLFRFGDLAFGVGNQEIEHVPLWECVVWTEPWHQVVYLVTASVICDSNYELQSTSDCKELML